MEKKNGEMKTKRTRKGRKTVMMNSRILQVIAIVFQNINPALQWVVILFFLQDHQFDFYATNLNVFILLEGVLICGQL